MNIRCLCNYLEFDIRVTNSYVRGFNIDIVEDRDVKSELLKFIDILNMSRNKSLVFTVNSETVMIDSETIEAFLCVAANTNEFFNRTIYQILSFVIKNSNQKITDIYSHSKFKRVNWKDYDDNEILQIPSDIHIYDILCNLNLKLDALLNFGHIHALAIYKSGYDITKYDIKSQLTKFKVNEVEYLCYGVHFDDETIYISNLDKMLTLDNNDSIHLHIAHYNIFGLYTIVSIDIDIYSRSYIIKIKETKYENNQ